MNSMWDTIVQEFCKELPNGHGFHAKDVCERIVHPTGPQPMQWESTGQLVEYLYDYLASVRVRTMFHEAWNSITNMQNVVEFERQEARLVHHLISHLEQHCQFPPQKHG